MVKMFQGIAALIARTSIRSRIASTMTVLTIVALGALGSLSYRLFEKSSVAKIVQANTANLVISNEILQMKLAEIQKSMRDVLVSNAILDIVRKARYDAAEQTAFDPKTSDVLDREVQRIFKHHKYVSSVTLFETNGSKIYHFRFDRVRTPFRLSGPAQDAVQKSDWYRMTLEIDGKEIFWGANLLENLADHDGKSKVFSCSKLIRDPDGFQPLGIILVDFDKEMLSNVFGNTLWKPNANLAIVDNSLKKNRHIVYDISADRQFDKWIDTFFSSSYQDRRLLISHVTNQITNWELLSISQRSVLAREAGIIGVITVVVAAVMMLIVTVLSIFIARTITKPLEKLEKAIKDFGSGNTEIPESFGNDEIGLIGKQFKSMARRITQLQKRLLHLALKNKDAELKALQAQINPHFLYNTLDSIYWMASLKKEKDIAQLAISLSEVFRFALNNGNEVTTVRDELRHVENYLIVQNIRYRGRFATEMSVEETIKDQYMLKLLIQPLVENAIHHGLEPKQGKGTLTLRGFATDEALVFEVEDDGVGMDEQKRRQQGFGLHNVEERIRLYYGKQYGLSIDSAPGRGTKVKIEIARNLKRLPDGN